MFFVNFADFWLGDQLNSLVPAITDFEYFICFYASNNGNWARADESEGGIGCFCLLYIHREYYLGAVDTKMGDWVSFLY